MNSCPRIWELVLHVDKHVQVGKVRFEGKVKLGFKVVIKVRLSLSYDARCA